jgi:hypothetical protein
MPPNVVHHHPEVPNHTVNVQGAASRIQTK